MSKVEVTFIGGMTSAAGRFKPGDTVKLPAQDAQALIDRGICKSTLLSPAERVPIDEIEDALNKATENAKKDPEQVGRWFTPTGKPIFGAFRALLGDRLRTQDLTQAAKNLKQRGKPNG